MAVAGTPVKASGSGNFKGGKLGQYRTLFLLVISRQKHMRFRVPKKKLCAKLTQKKIRMPKKKRKSKAASTTEGEKMRMKP